MARDFVLAALPWVLCGVAVALICAGLGRKSDKKGKSLDQRVALGTALGLLLGVTLNGLELWQDHAVVLALGPLWGMALAVCWPENRK